MNKLVFCIFTIIFPLMVKGQKGFQIGVGLNHIITNNETIKYFNEDEVKVSNLYGASLNIDYRFDDKFTLKSGLEYKSQNIDFENLTNYRVEYISIPLILNINVLKLEQEGLSFGVDAGVSFDKPSLYSGTSIINSSDGNRETITKFQLDSDNLPTRVFEFSDFISLRLGINATYNIGKRGQLNFFVHKTNNGFKWGFPYSVNEQVSLDGQEISNVTKGGYLNISNTGIQFGLYYTFGTLTFK